MCRGCILFITNVAILVAGIVIGMIRKSLSCTAAIVAGDVAISAVHVTGMLTNKSTLVALCIKATVVEVSYFSLLRANVAGRIAGSIIISMRFACLSRLTALTAKRLTLKAVLVITDNIETAYNLLCDICMSLSAGSENVVLEFDFGVFSVKIDDVEYRTVGSGSIEYGLRIKTGNVNGLSIGLSIILSNLIEHIYEIVCILVEVKVYAINRKLCVLKEIGLTDHNDGSIRIEFANFLNYSRIVVCIVCKSVNVGFNNELYILDERYFLDINVKITVLNGYLGVSGAYRGYRGNLSKSRKILKRNDSIYVYKFLSAGLFHLLCKILHRIINLHPRRSHIHLNTLKELIDISDVCLSLELRPVKIVKLCLGKSREHLKCIICRYSKDLVISKTKRQNLIYSKACEVLYAKVNRDKIRILDSVYILGTECVNVKTCEKVLSVVIILVVFIKQRADIGYTKSLLIKQGGSALHTKLLCYNRRIKISIINGISGTDSRITRLIRNRKINLITCAFILTACKYYRSGKRKKDSNEYCGRQNLNKNLSVFHTKPFHKHR